jgi:hypothetical protein
MSVENWIASDRPQKIQWMLTTNNREMRNSIRELTGRREVNRTMLREYKLGLARDASAKEISDVIIELNIGANKDENVFAHRDAGTIKYNVSFTPKGDTLSEVQSNLRKKINKLVAEYPILDSFIKQNEALELLYKFSEKTLGSPLSASAKTREREDLDNILHNFKVKGKKMSHARLVKEVGSLSIRDIDLMEGNEYLTNSQLANNHKLVLLDVVKERAVLRLKLDGFISKLRSIETSGKDDIKTVHPDLFIGKLNLKHLRRRNSIYKYWKNRHGEFETYVDAQNLFIKTLEEVLELIKTTDEQRKVYDNYISELKDNKLTKEDNYIIEVPSKDIKVDDVNIQALILLTEFIDIYEESKKKGSTQDTPEESSGEDIIDPDFRVEGHLSDAAAPKTQAEHTTHEGLGVSQEEGQLRTKPLDENVIDTLIGEIKSVKSFKKVDPLFYHAWSKGAFGRVPLFKKDLASLKRRVKKKANRIDIFVSEGEMALLDDYLEDLYDTATDIDSSHKFYLPLTPKVTDLLPTNDKDTLHKKLEAHFKIMTSFISQGDMKGKGFGTQGKTLHGQQEKNPREQYSYLDYFPSRKPKGETLPNLIEVIGKSYEDYLEVLLSIIVTPLTSRFIEVLGDDQTFITGNSMNLFMDENKNPNAHTILLRRWMELGTATVSPTQLVKLTKLLVEISKSKTQKRMSVLLPIMNDAATQLDAMFDHEQTQNINIHFGATLYEIKMDNNIKETIEFNGETAEEWHKLYSDEVTYPLDALETHISSRKSAYESDRRLKEPLVDFFASLNIFEFSKSEIERDILIAHDTIRKMLGKPIYYNISKLDNYDHVNCAIDIVKEKYKIELSVMDIESIVNEFDSMSSISKKHGIPQETVYFLKANFR